MRLAALLLLAACAAPAPQVSPMLDTDAIERILGAKGKLFGPVFKVAFPRNDLDVRVDGFRITPFMGLTTWFAFKRAGDKALVMGDMVLTEGEVARVTAALVEAGVEVSALHNHFLRESPRVMFLHVHGLGGEASLASGLKKALGEIRAAGAPKVADGLDEKILAEAAGGHPDSKDGVHKFVWGRTAIDAGVEIDSAMGVNSWAAIQGTMERAAACGDFAMLEGEVAGVVSELRRSGIEVVAVHHHMLFEEPRIIFLHFWGVGKATDLLASIRRALGRLKGPAGH